MICQDTQPFDWFLIPRRECGSEMDIMQEGLCTGPSNCPAAD